MFFPRGGSATVMRALARRLPAHNWETCLVAGSLPGHGDAERFYSGVEHVHPVLFAPHGDVPLHPSFEGDEAFASLGDDELERHVTAWSEHLVEAGAPDKDVLHLHHLTPLNEVARRIAPGVPVVAHLHGTELLMLERIAEDRPASWVHADAWAERLREWAHGAARIVVPARAQLPRVQELLGISRERCTVLPNGVDLALFDRVEVERPEHTTVLYVGRFTEVKRLPLLIETWAEVLPRFERPAELVIVGGHPGEWEGEHPEQAIARTGAEHVHLAGWFAQEDLPPILSAADLLVMPSVREQFGLVIVEGMACGLPPIAADAYGPRDIVEDGETGWLVTPDDRGSLGEALVEAVNDPAERKRRGRAAREVARRRYGWDAIAGRLAGILDEVRASGGIPLTM
jgi:glycosyltransferase involved in cell wall biosynthesis